MATRARQAEIDEAREWLRGPLKPGDTVYTVLRHVSRSGMSRVIDLYKLYVTEEGKPGRLWISGHVATALDMKRHKRFDGVVIGGCGMDMGFALVHALSYALYPDGQDASGAKPGYAFKHEWL